MTHRGGGAHRLHTEMPTRRPTTHLSAQTPRAVVAALLLAAAVPAHAFHSGGVAACEGCHSMHNSSGGTAMSSVQGGYLLRGSDASSVCLHCHEGAGVPGPRAYLVSTASSDMNPGFPPNQLTPAGDFGWLRKTYEWASSPGALPSQSPGEHHGHNVVAGDYGYLADGTRTVAPGGTFPSSLLHCTSCHDPHGRHRRLADGTVSTTGLPIMESGSYDTSPDPVASVFAVGVYRLLGGPGYRPPYLGGSVIFQADAPDAVAPSAYNRSEDVTQTRVAYGRGMTEWCLNCHPSLANGSATSSTSMMVGTAHPVGNAAKLPVGIQSNYIAYVRTGVISNRDITRSYLSLVPFEEGTRDYSILKRHARTDDTALGGPDANSNVSCLTCHRAHASGFDSAMRFRPGNTFITVADATGAPIWPLPATAPLEAQGRSQLETQRSYYGRPANVFSAFQATLCNKCHVKD
jgi:hypothetical protein